MVLGNCSIMALTKIKKQEVLISPHVTEKATGLARENKYVFKVHPAAGKIEIKKAVKQVFKVTPVKVNVSNIQGKKRRVGRIQGQRPGFKKAVVTLKAGDSIENI